MYFPGGGVDRSVARVAASRSWSRPRRQAKNRDNFLFYVYLCLRIAGFPAFQENTMVVIRLARSGAKKRPFFNMVVADSRNRRDGRFIERIGYYNPVAAANEQGLVINTERLAYWQGHGAQLSPTAARLVKQAATKAA